jgi:hypothetical protein
MRVLTYSSRLSLAAAGLAILACLAAVLAAFLPASGHPPLSDYVGAIAVPIAWILALFGVGSAIASRRHAERGHYVLALGANIVALVAGAAIWLLWPLLRAA